MGLTDFVNVCVSTDGRSGSSSWSMSNPAMANYHPSSGMMHSGNQYSMPPFHDMVVVTLLLLFLS